jgi:TonB-dependent receptor
MPVPSSCKSLVVALLGLVAAGLLTPARPLAAQGVGRIHGRVTEEETGRPLDGARVQLRRSTLVAITDSKGRFILPRVPAGSDTLEVAYIGRQRQATPVAVGAGEDVEADFALPVSAVVLEEVQVLGVRAKNQAEALSRQQNASNIQNIVASDQMGRFPDASAPEAVQRLPGIAVERDQGEGRYIQIRGGSPQNTQVTFNGTEVPSPESEIRQIELDAVPVDILESIEVSKAITPDMDADAIGGSVNLVTKKAPDQTLFSVEAAGGYAPIREDFSGNGSATYGSRIADGRFGFLLSGSFARRNFGSDDVEPEFDIGDEPLDDDALEALDLRHYSLWRERTGATAAFDYRLTENSSLTLTGIFSQLADEEQRRRLINGVADGELEFRHKNRLEKARTYNVTLGGDHLTGGGIGIDYRLTWSRSVQDTPYDNEIFFVQEDVSFDPDISDPSFIRANPADGTVGGTYVFDAVGRASSFTANTDKVAALNFTVPYGLGRQASGSFRVGAKYRQKDKYQDVTEEEFELADGADDILLGQQAGSAFDTDGYLGGDYTYLPFSTTPRELLDFPDQFASSLDGGPLLELGTNDWDIDERVVAVYGMTEINLTPDLMILPGLRYEHTRFRGQGFAFDPDAETLTPQAGSKSYGRVFPGLHTRYRITPQTNLRAAFTTAMSRPNFIDLVPFRLPDEEDLTLGNPELDPTLSRNFDFLVEHYDSRIGVLSAGVFYKRLTDPIFLFIEDNELGGETTQPRNGDSGDIFGVELAVQQQLRMLPKPFDGLGIYANYTYTRSETTLPGGREARLQGQTPHVFNTALSYERGPFSGQVSLNFHDDFILEYGGDEGTPEERLEDIYVGDHLQLDLSANLRVTQTTAAFLELVNLTNEPFRLYQGVEERPRQREFYRSWGRFGFRFTR